MDNKNKKIIIVVIAVIFTVIIGLVVWSMVGRQTPQPSKDTSQTSNNTDDDKPVVVDKDGAQIGAVDHSEDEVSTFIAENYPSLIDQSTQLPVYTIISSTQPLQGWYVIKIRNNVVDTSDASIILKDVNGTLIKEAGPGTGLFNNTSLPEAVRKALQ